MVSISLSSLSLSLSLYFSCSLGSRLASGASGQPHPTQRSIAMSSSSGGADRYASWTDRDLALYACGEVEKLKWGHYLLAKEFEHTQTNHKSLRSWVQGNIDAMKSCIKEWAARAHGGLLQPAWENVKGLHVFAPAASEQPAASERPC